MSEHRLSTPLFRVVMADGAVHEVRAKNVDLVSWDRDRARHKWPAIEDAPFLWASYVAWHALTRLELIAPMSLTAFESAADEVSAVDEDADEEDAGVDPTPDGSRARMIVALALATQTAPAAWWDADDATIATAIYLLDRDR